MSVRDGTERLSFAEAIKRGVELLRDGIEYPVLQKYPFHYLNRGFYDRQVKRYLDLFDKKNMMFILFEDDFIKNRKETFGRLLRFLEVDDVEINTNIQSYSAANWRSKKLNAVMNTANPVNRLARSLIPSRGLRMNVKYLLTKLNKRRTGDKSELEPVREYLIDDVFKESIANLEAIIGRDLSTWKVNTNE
jgi:hypothetical protein